MLRSDGIEKLLKLVGALPDLKNNSEEPHGEHEVPLLLEGVIQRT